jgi:hypothetical protein
VILANKKFLFNFEKKIKMKNIIYIILTAILIFGCTSNEEKQKKAMQDEARKITSEALTKWFNAEYITQKQMNEELEIVDKLSLINPDVLEINGKDYKFETNYIKLFDNKYNIKLTF